MSACAESAVSRSRIMMPAFTQSCTYSIDVTRAMTSTSPFTGCQTNRNASALPQISAPPPSTVNVPLVAVAVPVTPTAPISSVCQGEGSVGAGGGDAATVTVTVDDAADRLLLSTARALRV